MSSSIAHHLTFKEISQKHIYLFIFSKAEGNRLAVLIVFLGIHMYTECTDGVLLYLAFSVSAGHLNSC